MKQTSIFDVIEQQYVETSDSTPTLNRPEIHKETSLHGNGGPPPPNNILKKPGGVGETPTDTLQQTLPFDPIAVENLRQAIIDYDMMLLKNPQLKEYVKTVLEEHKKLTEGEPH